MSIIASVLDKVPTFSDVTIMGSGYIIGRIAGSYASHIGAEVIGVLVVQCLTNVIPPSRRSLLEIDIKLLASTLVQAMLAASLVDDSHDSYFYAIMKIGIINSAISSGMKYAVEKGFDRDATTRCNNFSSSVAGALGPLATFIISPSWGVFISAYSVHHLMERCRYRETV